MWLERILSHLSAVEAVLSFLGSIVVAMIPFWLKIRAELKRNEAAMRQIPPSLPPSQLTPAEIELADNAALHRKVWARDERIRAMGAELSEVGADQAKLAHALNESEIENERLRTRLAEFESAGHTRPTPRTGTRARRTGERPVGGKGE